MIPFSTDISSAEYSGITIPFEKFSRLSSLQLTSIQFVRRWSTCVTTGTQSEYIFAHFQWMLCSLVADCGSFLSNIWSWSVLQNTRWIYLRLWCQQWHWQYQFGASTSCPFRIAQSSYNDDCYCRIFDLGNTWRFLEEKVSFNQVQLSVHIYQFQFYFAECQSIQEIGTILCFV